MTPEDIAIFTLTQEGTQGKEVAQAYLDLLKKWDGLDDPSDEMVKAGNNAAWYYLSDKNLLGIFNAMIKEAKK